MITVVDTSVWSLVLRRRPRSYDPSLAEQKLRAMIENGEPIVLPGIVLQELLSGLKSEPEFHRLLETMSSFDTVCADVDHHVEAARIFNNCRVRGIAVTATDCLIAATTRLVDGKIMTCDRDYRLIAGVVDLRVDLFEV